MKRSVMAVLCAALISFPALADFDVGMAAYRAKDFKTAFQAFHDVAIQGNEIAQFNLGVMYYRGEGVDRDLVRALAWVDLSAQRGDEHNIGAEEALILMMDPAQINEAHAMAASLAVEHGLRYTPPNFKELDSRLAINPR
ncbi:MAG: hypothetical protein QNJ40_13425 [Xanthomonadales bacterium]|nr:hypothetical protein [Xanthomonadales bacterium]